LFEGDEVFDRNVEQLEVVAQQKILVQMSGNSGPVDPVRIVNQHLNEENTEVGEHCKREQAQVTQDDCTLYRSETGAIRKAVKEPNSASEAAAARRFQNGR
jgi:hypothetical protein